MDSGSSLSLALADMTESSASITVIPDRLSGVECVSANIKFPDLPSNGENHQASMLSITTPASHNSTQHAHSTGEFRSTKAEPSMRATVESYYSLPDMLNKDDEMSDKTTKQLQESLNHSPTAQTLMKLVQSTRSTRRSAYKKKFVSLIPNFSFGIEIAVSWTQNNQERPGRLTDLIQESFALAALFILIDSVLKPVQLSSFEASSHLQNLKHKLEFFAAYTQENSHLFSEKKGDHYVILCYQNVLKASKEYIDHIWRFYSGKHKIKPFIPNLSY
jgi:hypothetical protein